MSASPGHECLILKPARMPPLGLPFSHIESSSKVFWGRGLRAAGPSPYEKLSQTPTPNPLSLAWGRGLWSPPPQTPSLGLEGRRGGRGRDPLQKSPWPFPHKPISQRSHIGKTFCRHGGQQISGEPFTLRTNFLSRG